MYNGKEENLVCILTQERLLRLLKKKSSISFDYVIVDEAHGLLHDDNRNMLLASVILILKERNSNTIFKFLTPFLCEPENMKVRYANYSVKTYKVNEYIKSERIYIADLRQGKREFSIYDQFMNEFYKIKLDERIRGEGSFVKIKASEKNIVYLNKPKDIEKFARGFCHFENQISTEKIEEACKNIAEYVHPKYSMINCLKHGIIYHHGSVPEPIRIYIESLYTELTELKYVITSSTLLEGVNIPAYSMFILDNKKGRRILSPSDFKNLIGRVCRFSQVFDKDNGSLSRLEPEIYLVGGQFYSSNANIGTFIKETMNVEKKIEDSMKNVLMENTAITDENREKLVAAEEFVENYEPGIFEGYDLRRVTTEVGESCFANNILEFDIFNAEEELDTQVLQYKESDPRNKALMKMFNMINIGERAGSGVPNIFNVWEDEGWVEPVIEERFDPDRTVLTLEFVNKTEIKKATEKSAEKKATEKSDRKKVTKKTQEQYDIILNFMDDGNWYKAVDLVDELGVKETRTKELLRALVKLDLLEDDGATKGKKYHKKSVG